MLARPPRFTPFPYTALFRSKLIDHYENPRNVGSLDKNDEAVGTGLVGAPACGDVMKLQIKVGADGIIEDAKFKTFGCRSEEHTSELQSLRHLVCRLLLAKKK